jgi:rhodanese-related sulfurtransferase
MAVTPHDLVIEAKAQIKEVSTAEAQSTLTGYTVIDVREYDEFAAGHLPGAINIPRGVLEFKIGTVGECADKDKPYLLYCRTSGRAALSTVQLQKIGYSKLVSMAGGFEAWAKEERPTDKPAPVNFD